MRRRRRSGGGSSFALFYSSASFLLFFFKQIENPRYLREKPIPLSPVSVKALPSAPHELRKMMKRRMRKRREQESVCLIFTLSLSLPCSPPLCTMSVSLFLTPSFTSIHQKLNQDKYGLSPVLIINNYAFSKLD